MTDEYDIRETPVILALMLKSEENEEFPMHVVISGVCRFPDSSGETVEHSLSGWHVPGDEVNAEMLLGAVVIGASDIDAAFVAKTDQDCAMIRDTMNEVLGKKDEVNE